MSDDSPSINERIDLWRFAYARSSLNETIATASLLLKITRQITLEHRTALVTSLAVTYARPFTKSQVTKTARVQPLHDVPIPPEHAELHKTFMEMRDSVFGHKDATNPLTEHGALNHLLLDFSSSGMQPQPLIVVGLDQPQLDETLQLCAKLIARVDKQIRSWVAIHAKLLTGIRGTYMLNLQDDSDTWLLPQS